MRTPQLIFGIPTYNSAKYLRACLESIKPYADRIIVVDGRFKDWPYPTKNSTDDTLTIAREYGCEVIVSGDLPQHLQRDLYLVGEEGDIYFFIDSDIVLEGTLEKDALLQSASSVWGVKLIDIDGREKLWPFIRRHVGQQPHHNVGQLLIDGYGRLMDATHPDGGGILTECWLRHVREPRTWTV